MHLAILWVEHEQAVLERQSANKFKDLIRHRPNAGHYDGISDLSSAHDQGQ
jgi:hypothetical protein